MTQDNDAQLRQAGCLLQIGNAIAGYLVVAKNVSPDCALATAREVVEYLRRLPTAYELDDLAERNGMDIGNLHRKG